MNEYRTMRRWSTVTRVTAGVMIALGSMSIATHSAAQVQVQPPVEAAQAQAVQAGEPDADVPVTRIGDAAHSILAIQRSGQAASPAQPMLGPEASAAYARYLKSFDHPIPEHLDSSVGTVGGAIGGGAAN
ncbi:hypothetical protein ABH944_000890 [Caballeronia udeis]|uniref:DUF3613 domain-containing protein n=1 Tax=Caballeronia udeis TaxID=1232866 RepID=A0ABW8MAP4_9BURK